MSYEEALARLIKKNENLDFLPVIREVAFDGGGDVQIGDYTWDHDNASLQVIYTHPDGTPGRRYKYHVDFEYYGAMDKRRHMRTGFAGFMDDLLEAASDNET